MKEETKNRERCEQCGRKCFPLLHAGFKAMCSVECANEYRISEGFPAITEEQIRALEIEPLTQP